MDRVDRDWLEKRRKRDAREARAVEWAKRRRALGLTDSREELAPMLGLSFRTLQRYEYGEAPGWYDLALVGLSVKIRGKHKP